VRGRAASSNTQFTPMLSLAARVHRLKAETFALYLAARDPRTPWYARVFVAGVVAYALSPIDLIPDFVPILGLLDDLILVPLGIAAALRMIPPQAMNDARERAEAMLAETRPVSRIAAAVIVAIWIGAIAIICVLAWQALH
jgi:uncharacterized membrane protein YkvA (DUF1232 family)